MTFTDPAFLLLFLPLVLAAAAGAMGWRGGRAGLLVLLGASLLFYGGSRMDHLGILLGSMAGNHAIASLLAARPAAPSRPALLGIGIAANLLLLGVFKYSGFAVQTLNAAGTGWSVPTLALPLAISFYTFQQITFIVDTARGRIGRVAPLEYAVAVSFFPHLIAGPLVRYHELIGQLRERLHVCWGSIALGLPLFVFGGAKKLLLADPLGGFIAPIYAAAAEAPVDAARGWVGALGFTLQIYYDFSGYSDMALGLGLMFGIRLPANFAAPYKARSVVEFWRRWHITLSAFLRDYLYIPLGGNRRGQLRRHANLLAVMLLGGLWHGAAWTFVFWGLMHGIYLVVAHGWGALVRRPALALLRLPAPLAAGLTFLAVVVAWVFFRAPSFEAAFAMLRGMRGDNGVLLPGAIHYLIDRHIVAMPTSPWAWLAFGPEALPYRDLVLAVAWIILGLIVAWCCPTATRLCRAGPGRAGAVPAGVLVLAGMLAFLCGFALLGEAPSTFIYFRF